MLVAGCKVVVVGTAGTVEAGGTVVGVHDAVPACNPYLLVVQARAVLWLEGWCLSFLHQCLALAYCCCYSSEHNHSAAQVFSLVVYILSQSLL
jgi:hypothetical protein